APRRAQGGRRKAAPALSARRRRPPAGRLRAAANRFVTAGRREEALRMRIPFISSLRREYALQPLSAAESAIAAALHAEGFSRPWTDEEFASLLSQDTVFGFAAREVGKGAHAPAGFVLARLAAGEAEILTIV